MKTQSAGILVFRRTPSGAEVLLAHPGGPFWAKKDQWSIPKGELDEGEDHETAARREFKEEVGVAVPGGDLIELGEAKSGSKINFIWAVEGSIDLSKFKSNTFTMEWPPKSGNLQEFPENDRVQWFDLRVARQKVYKSQTVFIERLAEKLSIDLSEPRESEPTQQSLL